MRHGSLFSGIGGFDLASSWMGWENVFQVEIDPYCQKVLQKNFPDTDRYLNIFDFDGSEYKGAIDIISGGFPCPPFSKAGRRKGIEDHRFLWPEMFRVIKEVRPQWVVAENVPGIENMALEMVLSSLESEGYKVETYNIPASAVGAWHRRERIWIIAHNNCNRRKEYQSEKGCHVESVSPVIPKNIQPTHLNGKSLQRYPRYEHSREEWEEEIGRDGQSYWAFPWIEVAPGFCRSDDGLPYRMDRIKGLGNAVVPQIAYEIFKAIELTEMKLAS